MSLQGRVALVTGASRGIGAEIADELGRHGATVAGTATTVAGAAAISERFAKHNIAGAGFVLNVTDSASVENALKEIENKFGAPLILINNAGIARDNLMLRMKDEEWNDVIETNLTAVFRMTRACLRSMVKARWGRIIMISSLSGLAGNAGQANYSATKAGVIGFAKSLAQEIASRNITVNVVAPGLIETDMAHALTDAQKEQLLARIPMSRLGKPSEIAGSVAFLCSDTAAYITGETLSINGGMYMQ